MFKGILGDFAVALRTVAVILLIAGIVGVIWLALATDGIDTYSTLQ